LEEAGFECIAFNELNEDAADSFKANFPNATPFVGSIEKELTDAAMQRILDDPRIVGSIDLVCGGPPCQGFSGIGHRRTHEVEKRDIPTNHLFHEMIRVIKRLNPKAFLFENVQGILSGKWTSKGENGEIFWDVWKGFAEIEGYVIQPGVVRGYRFGVPQNRPRVMIVGVRKELLRGKGVIPRLAIPDKKNRHKLTLAELDNRGGLLPRRNKIDAPDLIDVIGDLDFEGWTEDNPHYPTPKSEQSEFAKEMREKVPKDDEVRDHKFSNHSKRIVKKFQYMIDNPGKKLPKKWQTKKFNQRVTPEKWGRGVKPWITVTSLPDDYVHYARPRSFSVREWARIQTFPDHHVFHGKRTTGGHRRAGNPSEGNWERDLPIYTQIGNAVPPKMAEHIGKHLKEMIGPIKKAIHTPLGREYEQTRRITSSLPIDDYVTIRITRRAGGFGGASGGDSDAPKHLQQFLKRWNIVDYDDLGKGKENGKEVSASLITKRNGIQETKVGFNRTKERGRDRRFWPKMPFKKSLTGNRDFNGDLLIFMVSNGDPILALAGDIDTDVLSRLSSDMGISETDSALIELVYLIVDIHEAGWIDSVSVDKGTEPADRDVGMTLERECSIIPNASVDPDWKGKVEIKSSAQRRKHLDNIISVVPGRGVASKSRKGNWEDGMSEIEICREFGKPDQKGRRYGLKNNIRAGHMNTHQLMIEIDREESELRIIGESKEGKEKLASTYDFERMRAALENKHPCTVWATAEKSEDQRKFRYTKITITKKPVFENVLSLIEQGSVIFDYKMAWDGKSPNLNSGASKGHGPCFRNDSKSREIMFMHTSPEINLDELAELRNSDSEAFRKHVLRLITRLH
jgi:DNA (cytosine-5)-methyltransferase 1